MQSIKLNSKFKVLYLVVILLVTISLISSRVYAGNGNFRAGWNILVWPSGTGNSIKYSSLPSGCDQLSVRNNNWYETWVRGYTADGTFEVGKNYYVKCASEAGWEM